MKRYKVFRSERFNRELSKYERMLLNYVDNLEEKLAENPYTRKPLGLYWFREKKLDKYRIYYLIYENLDSVFMVAISGKKDQQKVINTIRLLLEYFREELKKLLQKDD